MFSDDDIFVSNKKYNFAKGLTMFESIYSKVIQVGIEICGFRC
ncbi:13679_t:CDS:2 [Entrophospora sp. SA101]|nr:13679_t:CDS:2 [Entrophospora sp. SA101]